LLYQGEAMARSLETLVEQQARRWQLTRQEQHDEARRAVITVSRQHGAGGGELVRTLAREMGLDVYDREILHQIAESTHLSERVVQALDERARELLTEWLSGMASREYLSSVEYRYQLARVVGALAHHGGAIILGRGAHLILGRGEALRVLVVAPLEARVATIVEREGVTEREARRQILAIEADRKAFLMKHFHASFDDPTHFDLIVNTSVLQIPASTAVIRAAAERLVAAPPAASRA
jgi:cytidylate kinase